MMAYLSLLSQAGSEKFDFLSHLEETPRLQAFT